MKSVWRKLAISSVAVFMLAGIFTAGLAFAEGAAAPAAAAPAAAAGGAPAPADEMVGGVSKAELGIYADNSFWGVIKNSGWIGWIEWAGLFGTSIATLALIIDAFITLRRSKLMPPELITVVRQSLNDGDLGAAIEACEGVNCPLTVILLAGFSNVSEGFDVIQDSVGAAADIESEKLMQRVNYLNLCAAIAPMLGLMGTVTGMVDAFAALGSATGALKAAILASSISQALYTTAVGLLAAVPAILGFTFIRNYTSQNILMMESLTYDLLKVLRNAEVVNDSENTAE